MEDFFREELFHERTLNNKFGIIELCLILIDPNVIAYSIIDKSQVHFALQTSEPNLVIRSPNLNYYKSGVYTFASE